MEKIRLEIIEKKTKKVTRIVEDEKEIYQQLSECLSARYIFKAEWIKKIKQQCNFDGTRTYNCYMNNDMIFKFVVKE